MALNEQEEFELLSLEREKGGFASTPGGAAVGNPNLALTGRTGFDQGRLLEGGAKIGASGAIGAALGTVAPEILKGLGAAAGAYPSTRPLGALAGRVAPFLTETGKGLEGARVKGALSGGVSGIGSESAGQVAEGLGAPGVVAEGARIVGGGGTGVIADSGLYFLRKYVTTPSLSFFAKMRKEGLRAILGKIDDSPQSLTQQERDYVAKLTDELRAAEKSGKPTEEVFDGLAEGAGRHIALGETEATRILSEAEKESRRVLIEAQGGRMNTLRDGRERLADIGETALEAARNQRLRIGNDLEVNDIGTQIRAAVVGRKEGAYAQRKAQYSQNEKARDAIVQQQEGAGKYIDQTPEYAALVSSLKDEMKPGKHSPDVADNFAHILKQVQTKARPVEEPFGGMGGDPFAVLGEKKPPVSFQQIDDVRRQLGEVFKGNPPEGYKAIDADTARRYYARLRDLQIKYGGGPDGPQAKLLADYEAGSEAFNVFRGKSGAKIAGVDRWNDDEFVTNASAIPRAYFKDADGVKALKRLVGDDKLVTQAAKDYATNELRGKSLAQVQAWQNANSDWLKTMPEVNFAVGKYSMLLEKGERIAKSTQIGAKRVAEQEATRLADATALAKEISTEAQRGAAAVRGEAGRRADALVGKDFPIPRVRNLIESGDRVAWELAGPAIAESPKAKAAFSQAVRQVLSDVQPTTKEGAKGLQMLWEEKLRIAIEQSNLMPAQEIASISAKLEQIAALKVPEAERIGRMKLLMLNSVGGYAASLGARGAIGGTSALADMIPN